MKQTIKCACASRCTLIEVDDLIEDEDLGMLEFSFYVVPNKESFFERVKLAIKVLKYGSALQNSILIKNEDFERLKSFINGIKKDK